MAESGSGGQGNVIDPPAPEGGRLDLSTATYEQVLFAIAGVGKNLNHVLDVGGGEGGWLKWVRGGPWTDTPSGDVPAGGGGSLAYSYTAYDEHVWFEVNYNDELFTDWNGAINAFDSRMSEVALGRGLSMDSAQAATSAYMVQHYMDWLDQARQTAAGWVNRLDSPDSEYKGRAAYAIQGHVRQINFVLNGLYEQLAHRNPPPPAALEEVATELKLFGYTMAKAWHTLSSGLAEAVRNTTVQILQNVAAYVQGSGIARGHENYVLENARWGSEAKKYVYDVLSTYSSGSSSKVASLSSTGGLEEDRKYVDGGIEVSWPPPPLPDGITSLRGDLTSQATWNMINHAISESVRNSYLMPLNKIARAAAERLEQVYANVYDRGGTLAELYDVTPPTIGTAGPGGGSGPDVPGGGEGDGDLDLDIPGDGDGGGGGSDLDRDGDGDVDFDDLGDGNGEGDGDVDFDGDGSGGNDEFQPPGDDFGDDQFGWEPGGGEGNGELDFDGGGGQGGGGLDFNGGGGQGPPDPNDPFAGNPNGNDYLAPPPGSNGNPWGGFGSGNPGPDGSGNRRDRRFDPGLDDGNPFGGGGNDDEGWSPDDPLSQFDPPGYNQQDYNGSDYDPPNYEGPGTPRGDSGGDLGLNPPPTGDGDGNLPWGDGVGDSDITPPGNDDGTDTPWGDIGNGNGSGNGPSVGEGNSELRLPPGPGGGSGSSDVGGFGEGDVGNGQSSFGDGPSSGPNSGQGGGSGFAGEGWSDWSGDLGGTGGQGNGGGSGQGRGGGSPMMPPMMPPMGGMGGMGGSGGRGEGDRDRERQTWLSEDDEVWGAHLVAGNGVIGRPDDGPRVTDDVPVHTHVHTPVKSPIGKDRADKTGDRTANGAEATETGGSVGSAG